MKIKLNLSSPRGRSIVVVNISEFLAISLPQIPKTVQLSTGKNSAKCNALNSYIECDFADPQREGYKVHSLLGSVDNSGLRQSSPSLQLDLWNLQKSSRHVTSRNQGTFTREEERGPWERGWFEGPSLEFCQPCTQRPRKFITASLRSPPGILFHQLFWAPRASIWDFVILPE